MRPPDFHNMSREELIECVKQQYQHLIDANDEIVRLYGVIERHVAPAAAQVCNSRRADIKTLATMDEIITLVRMEPNTYTYEFRLAEPLSGWSDDHREAFRKVVTRGFAAREADAIAQSIWGAMKGKKR